MHPLHRVGGSRSFSYWRIRQPVLRSNTRLEGYTIHIHLHLILGREYLSVPERITRIARAIIVEGGTSSLRMLDLNKAVQSLLLLTNDTVRKKVGSRFFRILA